MTVHRRLRPGQSIEIEREQGVTQLGFEVHTIGPQETQVTVAWIDASGDTVDHTTPEAGVDIEGTLHARTDRAKLTADSRIDLLVYAGWDEV